VLTTEWDFAELRALWESSEVRVRSQLTAAQAHQLLAAVHRQLQEPPLLEAKQQAPPNPPAEHNASTQRPPELSLDDLPVIASVTSRWPLPHTAPDSLHPAQEQVSWTIVGPPAPAPPRPVRYDEETDEMDALDDQEPRPQ
jgi:hypothetical protein